MWVLGIGSRSSARTGSTLGCWAISPGRRISLNAAMTSIFHFKPGIISCIRNGGSGAWNQLAYKYVLSLCLFTENTHASRHAASRTLGMPGRFNLGRPWIWEHSGVQAAEHLPWNTRTSTDRWHLNKSTALKPKLSFHCCGCTYCLGHLESSVPRLALKQMTADFQLDPSEQSTPSLSSLSSA